MQKKQLYSRKFEAAGKDSRKTWSIINEIRGKAKTKTKPSFIIDGELVENRRVIANEFNKFFTSIATNMNSRSNDMYAGIPLNPIPDFATYMDKRISESIYLRNCTHDEILSIIKDLDNGKASDISITIIKKCPTIIMKYLSQFYNSFIEKGIFPSILKIGHVSPIYKKGNSQLLENYRPISTLPLLSKIFEKIIYVRIYDYLISKNILYDKQFGFRKNHSTSHAVNYSIDHILNGIENKKHVIGIFIDLSKAFDTISHEKLLDKLENYGIRGNCHLLIKNYITSRKQHTIFMNEKSDSNPISFGVPQGSVLGPLLFLLYINNIVQASTNGHFVLFADDTNIFITANTKEEAYNTANFVLKEVHNYMLGNQLHINLSKCVYMHFRPRMNATERQTCARTRPYNSELNLSLAGHKLKKVDKTRFLGVIIDDKLSWDDHIEFLEAKLNSCIVTIKRIIKFIPKSQFKLIYHSLFVSHLTYCISAWGGAASSKLGKLFSIQKRCIRILFGKIPSFDHAEYYETCARARSFHEHKQPKNYVLEHTKQLFNENGFLAMQNLYFKNIFIETFKIFKNHTPISIYSLFSYNTFSKRQLLLTPPMFSLDISKQNFVAKACTIWNSCISKVLQQSPLNNQKCVVIMGAIDNSDLSASIGYIKSTMVKYLLDKQKKGCSDEWQPINFIL